MVEEEPKKKSGWDGICTGKDLCDINVAVYGQLKVWLTVS